jgi:Predicted nucleic acid-binding protein, contains PIN domain
MYVLDTDHCIELLRGNPKIVSKFKSLRKNTVLHTTIITIAELLYGAHRLPNLQERLKEVDAFQEDIEILGLDLSAAKVYGRLKAELAQKGEILADNDLFIASITLSRRLVLVTHNSQHYKRISGLGLEDWVK